MLRRRTDIGSGTADGQERGANRGPGHAPPICRCFRTGQSVRLHITNERSAAICERGSDARAGTHLSHRTASLRPGIRVTRSDRANN